MTIKGVHWCESRNRWRAYGNVKGKPKTLGWFITEDDAIKARLNFLKDNPTYKSYKPRPIDMTVHHDHYGAYMIIYCSNGKPTKVDPDNYTELNQWSWQCNPKGYIHRTIRIGQLKTTIRMHRFVNNTPDGLFTDHVNGDPSDNRRANLRTCDRSQNEANKPPKSGKKCKYRGVTLTKSKSKPYSASIKYQGKNIYLGSYRTEESAALAYNEAAIRIFKNFAYLNELEPDYAAS